MAGGRPTKYCQEIVDKAWEYIEKYKDHGDVIPSHAGMACALDIGK